MGVECDNVRGDLERELGVEIGEGLVDEKNSGVGKNCGGKGKCLGRRWER